MNKFVIADANRCIGCGTCEIACVMAHRDGKGEHFAKESFHPRLRVVKSLAVSAPILCRQCEDAPCLNACPTGAIRRNSDFIQVQQSLCIGCKSCVIACPYGAMEVVVSNEAGCVKAQALKCDLCGGVEGGQACVRSCPTKALRLENPESLKKSQQQKRLRTALSDSNLLAK